MSNSDFVTAVEAKLKRGKLLTLDDKYVAGRANRVMLGLMWLASVIFVPLIPDNFDSQYADNGSGKMVDPGWGLIWFGIMLFGPWFLIGLTWAIVNLFQWVVYGEAKWHND